jgi:hypothetical protein
MMVVVVVAAADDNYDDILGLRVKVLKLKSLNKVRQTINSSPQCTVVYNTKH